MGWRGGASPYRLDYVGALEEAVLPPRPEREVALAVRDEQVVVQGVEGGTGDVIVEGLRQGMNGHQN